jgi:hypothetical protein
MPATYEPIASASPSAAANVTFSSIPGTFTDLVIVYSVTSSVGTEDMWLRYNNDTGSTNPYSATILSGTGSSAVSARLTNQNKGLLDYYAIPGTSARATGVVQIMSYSNPNVFKTALSSASRADAGVDRVVTLWRETTAAITVVTLFTGSGTITGTVSLYGIKAA